MSKLLAIRLVGPVHQMAELEDALAMLRLRRKFSAVVLHDSPAMRRALTKVSSAITWGELDSATAKTLAKAKVRANFYRLGPPHGGLGRRGIKAPFAMGGAMGYRGPMINELLRRMLR